MQTIANSFSTVTQKSDFSAIANSFSTVVQKIGFGVLGKLCGVPYQTISDFAKDPRPGGKFRVRGRILAIVIEQSEQRVELLRKEADELEKQVTGFKQWKDTAFDK